jgi:titin
VADPHRRVQVPQLRDSAAARPEPPSGLAATAASSSQINLTWTDNRERPASDNGAGALLDFGQIATVGTDATNYSNTGLRRPRLTLPGSSYNSGAPISTVTETTQAPRPPAAPSRMKASAIVGGSIRPTVDNSGTILLRSSTKPVPLALLHVGPNVTSYTDTG